MNKKKPQVEVVAMWQWLRSCWRDEEGLTSVEYALLLALLTVVGITAWQGLGGALADQTARNADLVAHAGE